MPGNHQPEEQDRNQRDQIIDPVMIVPGQEHGERYDRQAEREAKFFLFHTLTDEPDKLHGDHRTQGPVQAEHVIVRGVDQRNGDGEAERQQRQLDAFAPVDAPLQFFQFFHSRTSLSLASQLMSVMPPSVRVLPLPLTDRK